MPTASVPNTFVSGEPAFASAVNGNFAALVNLLNNGLDAGNLVDGAVTSAILADESVITAKILDGQVTDAKVSLTSAAIPNLDAAKIATGTFNDARIPNLAASKITSGEFAVDRIPGLPTSKIVSGTFSNDRIASGLDAGKLTTGTLPIARIANGAVTSFKLATTASEDAWVGARISGFTSFSIGAYVLARWSGSGSVSSGGTVSGSLLTPSGAAGNVGGFELDGTWRCMGQANTTSDQSRTTLWLKIS